MQSLCLGHPKGDSETVDSDAPPKAREDKKRIQNKRREEGRYNTANGVHRGLCNVTYYSW